MHGPLISGPSPVDQSTSVAPLATTPGDGDSGRTGCDEYLRDVHRPHGGRFASAAHRHRPDDTTAVMLGERAAPTLNVDSDTQITFALPDYSDDSHGSDLDVLVTTRNGISERNHDVRVQYGTAAP